jgi:hypothetical protein
MAKQQITVPKRLSGESEEAYHQRVEQWFKEDVRTKVDLREFKTADFSLDKSP